MRPHAPIKSLPVLAATLLLMVLGPSQAGAAWEPRVSGPISIDRLRAGDCLSDLVADTEVVEVERVSCERLHRGEVLSIVELSPRPYADEKVAADAREECGQSLRATYPFALEDPAAHLMFLQPGRAAWLRGDRGVTCVLMSEQPRTGPYEASEKLNQEQRPAS